MTPEERWLTATHFTQLDMRHAARGRDRKCRLFGCACVRRVLTCHPVERLSTVTGEVERFADGECSWDEVKAVGNSVTTARKSLITDGWGCDTRDIIRAISSIIFQKPFDALQAAHDTIRVFVWGSDLVREVRMQVTLAHDIFGNPFRPVAFSPGWRTSAAVALADAMYQARAFDRMPVLADALEDAGCDHPDVLAHCRGDDPHVRGCWVVDLVLGKA
jgi:hypothetical protein